MADESIGPMAREVIAHHKERAEDLVDLLHEIWRLSVEGKAEAENGEWSNASETFSKIGQLAAEVILPKPERK